MKLERCYYASTIIEFLKSKDIEVLGALTKNSEYALTEEARSAWSSEIEIMREVLTEINEDGYICFEFSIPRMGKRIDVVVVWRNIIFVLEFKVGEASYNKSAIDQVWDYALDLKNFHDTSHHKTIVPIVIATEAKDSGLFLISQRADDGLIDPIKANRKNLLSQMRAVVEFSIADLSNQEDWINGHYYPTPTIVEAAMALYRGHAVEDISRNDAGVENLKKTTATISEIIETAKDQKQKVLCFVTGVPGAGKTLVGLNIAMKYSDKENALHSVFLSGNGPLVNVLREALVRDKVAQDRQNGNTTTKKKGARQAVEKFIQNVHHFRDECLIDVSVPPAEHVTLFDEAQRAWDKDQTSNFMVRKKNRKGFNQSEPEFLISCVDRHKDWGVVICLVGGGQEINTGEAGISEWLLAWKNKFSDWKLFISSMLIDDEYKAKQLLEELTHNPQVTFLDHLHLSACVRSFRAERLSSFVKNLLDIQTEKAKEDLRHTAVTYPLVLTRDLNKAKDWLRRKARGSERYGLVVSSSAERLRPEAIFVKAEMNPIHWFLNGKDDVRSSYYLEDVATEFSIQGLELDWACVTWDADFRYAENTWEYFSFKGTKWQNVRAKKRQDYLKNAYRVLLTRARQGMVIVVPEGDPKDHTRLPKFYDTTFNYLKSLGLEVVD